MAETLKTINEVEMETGISAFTIRYYDKCGFFNPIARTRQGRRRFSDSDIDRLLLIDALRKSGLSIDGLKNVAPKLDDERYIAEIIGLCSSQLQALEIQIEELELCKQRLMNFAAEKACNSYEIDQNCTEGLYSHEIHE